MTDHLTLCSEERLRELLKIEKAASNAQALIKYIAGIPAGTIEHVPEFWNEIQNLCRLNDEKYVKFMRGGLVGPGEETDPMVEDNLK